VSRSGGRLACLLVLGLLAGAGPGAAPDGDEPQRQVTLWGIVASAQDPTVDPRLIAITPQLRRLMPDHGYWLRGVKSQRVAPGGTVTCEVGPDLIAEAKLAPGPEAGGKVRIQFTLRRKDRVEFATEVVTSANQPFFCDRPLPDGTRLLIGVGAR
jgi:hypothetical protein